MLNKNPDLINNLFGGAGVNNWGQNGSFTDKFNDHTSGKSLLRNFRYAPNYYEMVQCLSSMDNISGGGGGGLVKPCSNRDRSPSNLLQMVKAGLVGGAGVAPISSNSNIQMREHSQSIHDYDNGVGGTVQGGGQSNVSGLG